jgi:hypothetical protein
VTAASVRAGGASAAEEGPRAMARARISPAWAGLAAVLSAVIAVFGDAVLRGRVFFERDISLYWYPQVATLTRTLRAGSWPVWDTYERYGMPLLADPGVQLFYPTTWLLLLLPPDAVYTIMVVAHCVLAGMGVLLLCRRWAGSWLAGAVAGVAFATSGPFLSLVTLYHHFVSAAWIPWVLLALEKLLREPGLVSVALLAAAAAAQALGGSADMVWMTCLLCLVRVAHWSWTAARQRSGQERRRVAACVAAAGAWTMALAAAQWGPTAALLPGTLRGSGGVATLLWSLHPWSLADLIVPGLVNDAPWSLHWRSELFDGREPFLRSVYASPVILMLGAMAVASRRRAALGFAAAGAAFLLLSLGRHSAAAAAVLGGPVFSTFRYPVKYIVVAALAWSMLAGFGIQAWIDEPPMRRRSRFIAAAAAALGLAGLIIGLSLDGRNLAWIVERPTPGQLEFLRAAVSPKLVAAGAASLAAAALLVLRQRGPRWRRGTALAAGALASAELVLAGRGVNLLGPRDILAYRPPTLAKLGDDPTRSRLLSQETPLDWLNEHFTRGPSQWDRGEAFVLGQIDRLAPPTPARWGRYGSYDADVTGLGSPFVSYLTSAVYAFGDSAAGVRLLQMGNVGHVIAAQPGQYHRLEETFRVESIYDEPIRIFEVPSPVPAVYFASSAQWASSDDDALRAIMAPSFRLGSEVVLSGAGPGSADGAPAVAPVAGSVHVRERLPDRIVTDTESDGPGYLVVVEAFDGGWKATVDAAPAAVRRANVAFRAVAVPAGRHRVELRYRPPVVMWCAALSLLAWAGILASLAALPLRALIRRGIRLTSQP